MNRAVFIGLLAVAGAIGAHAYVSLKIHRYAYVSTREGYVEIDRLTQNQRSCEFVAKVVTACTPVSGNTKPN